ncbi:MAG: GNAT family N-acetyltransferase [Candidatus Thorarchaeota archaeon]|nr:MAG: GNAT family N-acetyltransferase [Candidatus Thorarchaeota archaeon]
MIQIREGREEDRPSVARVLWKAFEAHSTFEDVEKSDWLAIWNQPQNKDWAYVAIDGDKVIANLSFFITGDKDNIIRGKPIPFAGIWAVATDPVYRKQGLIRELFKETFPRMRKEGAVFSILDPFYRAFYEKFDYALGEKRAKHIFKKEDLRVGKTRKDIRVREVTGPEDIPKIIEIEKSMSRFGSRFYGFERVLNNSIKKGNFFIFENDKEALGTVKISFDHTHPEYKLTVGNTRYKSNDVFPSIVELVSKFAVNSSQVTWFTDYEVPVRHYFDSYSTTESHVLGSMMMRAIDFEKYCKSIAIPDSVSEWVTIKLEDIHCPWNTGTYTLIPNEGSLQVEKSEREPDINLNAFQLSQVISGVTPATILHGLNEIACSLDTAKKLEAIWPEDSFVSYMRF